LIYNPNAELFFRQRFSTISPTPVSHDPTRKSFLAKLTGLIAVAGFAPRLFARAASSPAVTALPPAPTIALRPDSRAVARRADSI
jgi:hypothetical protein